ncbi:HEPN domain-containing protein [Undibacterium umbellatum]|uniref:Apea-like HEPN domain-containing protein n=1 Tax=Undibacterium umbellatum TaxID=2762300 RepID=A0ABR6Z751_9BURK|nr:HEPN domain-containing protein [Undibacterium umbellatum]MBC3907156.1 hypothetical protein [Undibacterium umbellatum]
MVKANAKFNELAATALETQIVTILKSAQVIDGLVDLFGDSFSGYKASVKKYFSQWLDDYDANGIIIQSIIVKMPQVFLTKTNAKLSSVVSEEQILEVASDVVKYLSTLPRNYEILFPLPNIEISSDIFIFENISLILASRDQRELATSLLGKVPLETYLKVQVSGFASHSRIQSAMRSAISILKRIIQIGVTKKIFGRKMKYPTGEVQFDFFKPTQDVLEALIYDVDDTVNPTLRIKLGLGMSSYLSDLTLLTKQDLNSSANANIAASASVENEIQAILSLPTELLISTDSTISDNSASLRSAFEWAFDASADDDNAVGYIKTCIALEASLGEESEEGGITERLADRCAFLLCKTPVDRKITRDRMKQVYRLRSKLVHGVKTSISRDDQEIEFWGRTYLEMVLYMELKALEVWWRKKKSAML